MQNNYIYPAIFNYADDGISIEFPDLPGCLSSANTTEEALKNAEERKVNFSKILQAALREYLDIKEPVE